MVFSECITFLLMPCLYPLGASRLESLSAVQAPTETFFSLQKRTSTSSVSGPKRPRDSDTPMPNVQKLSAPPPHHHHHCCSTMCPRAQIPSGAPQWVSWRRAWTFGVRNFGFMSIAELGQFLSPLGSESHTFSDNSRKPSLFLLLLNDFNRKRRIYVPYT